VRPSLLPNALALLTTLVAALAWAGGADADRVRLSHADQAAASRDVLRLSDLPPTVTWTATKFNSNNSATPGSCSRLDFSSSQIVDTGQAVTQFATPGILVMNQVGLVGTSSMLGVIWKHVFARPMTSCIGDSFRQGGAGGIKLLSTTRLSLPRLAEYESAYRILFQLAIQGKNVRGAADLVVLGGERTLSMLMVMGVIGPASKQASAELVLTLIDVRLAQTIAGRAFAAGSPPGLTA
jgi:hypothetical protein